MLAKSRQNGNDLILKIGLIQGFKAYQGYNDLNKYFMIASFVNIDLRYVNESWIII